MYYIVKKYIKNLFIDTPVRP